MRDRGVRFAIIGGLQVFHLTTQIRVSHMFEVDILFIVSASQGLAIAFAYVL